MQLRQPPLFCQS